jgi:glycine dehydrogenase
MGYSDTHTPAVIQRNILENPGWYTAYTPYQPEIAQGRLEGPAQLPDRRGRPHGTSGRQCVLLDEGTAAAEAMALTFAVVAHGEHPRYLIDARCHPQTIAVVRTRAEARGVVVEVGDPETFVFNEGVVGCLVQYPATDGALHDYRAVAERAHAAKALVTAATDLLALTLLVPPGEWGADMAVGNSQRFGVPLGYGGPHAAFFATRDEYKRHLPGRIIGVSKDRDGRPALRMALQTREQHIRREKATSNVCTAQVLLAVIAGMYAVYHGPEGLAAIARRVHGQAARLARALTALGFTLSHAAFFDTIAVEAHEADQLIAAAAARRINLRRLGPPG